jgi:hypothetical protein
MARRVDANALHTAHRCSIDDAGDDAPGGSDDERTGDRLDKLETAEMPLVLLLDEREGLAVANVMESSFGGLPSVAAFKADAYMIQMSSFWSILQCTVRPVTRAL